MNQIKIGDFISLKPCFGMADMVTTRVTGLTLTTAPRTKYGVEVESVTAAHVYDNRVLFSYQVPDGSGRWAYSEQVSAWFADSAGGRDAIMRAVANRIA